MDREEFTGALAEAIEQYIGSEDVHVEDEGTIYVVADGSRFRIKIKRAGGAYEDDDDDDDAAEE